MKVGNPRAETTPEISPNVLMFPVGRDEREREAEKVSACLSGQLEGMLTLGNREEQEVF
jgi:hypothetical protein